MPKMPVYPDESFGKYFQSFGYPTANALADKVGGGISVIRKLTVEPDDVAPNSPFLPLIAHALGAPADNVIAFAKGAPMSEKYVKKVRGQIQHGTTNTNKPVRRKAAARRVPGEARRLSAAGVPPGNAGPFAQFVAKHTGRTVRAFSDATGIPQHVLWNMHRLAPNHPHVGTIADELGVSEAAVRKFAGGKPLTEAFLKAAATRAKSRDERKAERAKAPKVPRTARGQVLASIEVDTGDDVPSRRKPGTAAHIGRPRGATTNKLRKGRLDVRQIARAIANTVNYAIMRGEDAVPPIPTGDMRELLADYFEAKRVRMAVLLPADYAEAFD